MNLFIHIASAVVLIFVLVRSIAKDWSRVRTWFVTTPLGGLWFAAVGYESGEGLLYSLTVGMVGSFIVLGLITLTQWVKEGMPGWADKRAEQEAARDKAAFERVIHPKDPDN
jgi:hypothetical protein